VPVVTESIYSHPSTVNLDLIAGMAHPDIMKDTNLFHTRFFYISIKRTIDGSPFICFAFRPSFTAMPENHPHDAFQANAGSLAYHAVLACQYAHQGFYVCACPFFLVHGFLAGLNLFAYPTVTTLVSGMDQVRFYPVLRHIL
jgi:hypothetical protein